MEIRTARLLLRRPRSGDLEAFHRIMSDPLGMRYWSTLPHADRDVTSAWLDRMTEQSAAGSEHFVIEFNGQVIGDVGSSTFPEFGFMLAPQFWGRGFAREAATAFLQYAFASYPLPAITADVDPRNTRSLKLLEDLGFVVTGRAERTFLLGDEWCDSIYLSVPRPN